MATYYKNGDPIEISDSFIKDATMAFYYHKAEFDEFIKNNQKVVAVKFLKELTSGGLKESKDALELYIDGKLPFYIKEERRKKLERLAKKPLVDGLITKLTNISEDKLSSLLMNLSVDELLSIDDFFPPEEII